MGMVRWLPRGFTQGYLGQESTSSWQSTLLPYSGCTFLLTQTLFSVITMSDVQDATDPPVAPDSGHVPRREAPREGRSIPLYSLPRRGTCPSCKIGDLSRDYNLWRRCSVLPLLPDCLLDCCFSQEQRCPICEYVAPVQ
nr:uncharacterized protein LOC123765874 [Procambarus clarkii]